MSFLIKFVVMLTAFSYVLNIYAKKEHYNTVMFNGENSTIKVDCVTFTVTDYRVNPSQPSHIEIGKQLSHYDSNLLTLTARAGRKRSKTVAKYFNDQVGKDNSEGQYFGRLNFAIRGTLALFQKFQGRSCTRKIVEFRDIFLAQGNSLFSNYWVAGGKNCFHPHHSDQINCRVDYNPTGLFWSLGIIEGTHSTIDIIGNEKNYRKKWWVTP